MEVRERSAKAYLLKPRMYFILIGFTTCPLQRYEESVRIITGTSRSSRTVQCKSNGLSIWTMNRHCVRCSAARACSSEWNTTHPAASSSASGARIDAIGPYGRRRSNRSPLVAPFGAFQMYRGAHGEGHVLLGSPSSPFIGCSINVTAGSAPRISCPFTSNSAFSAAIMRSTTRYFFNFTHCE